MSCPTCDHTLEGVGDRVFWCPRCGTIAAHPRVLLGVPKLVERCRNFAPSLDAGDASRALWNRLGIAESITPPRQTNEGA